MGRSEDTKIELSQKTSPTVWYGLGAFLKTNPTSLNKLRRT